MIEPGMNRHIAHVLPSIFWSAYLLNYYFPRKSYYEQSEEDCKKKYEEEHKDD
jgi:hypothetical protein